jgi:hypothetical protein
MIERNRYDCKYVEIFNNKNIIRLEHILLSLCIKLHFLDFLVCAFTVPKAYSSIHLTYPHKQRQLTYYWEPQNERSNDDEFHTTFGMFHVACAVLYSANSRLIQNVYSIPEPPTSWSRQSDVETCRLPNQLRGTV